MKKVKLILGAFVGILLAVGLANVYWVYGAERFEVISEGKVYKSGAMSGNELKELIEKYDIKTIVDLRKSELMKEIAKERALAESLGVNHVNIPSEQVPADETVRIFLTVMDEKKNYPVLIHCEHGEGRAVLFSAIYRMEYENWDNENARDASRIINYGSSFSLTASKGKYLQDYTPRKKDVPAEIYTGKPGESHQGT